MQLEINLEMSGLGFHSFLAAAMVLAPIETLSDEEQAVVETPAAKAKATAKGKAKATAKSSSATPKAKSSAKAAKASAKSRRQPSLRQKERQPQKVWEQRTARKLMMEKKN